MISYHSEDLIEVVKSIKTEVSYDTDLRHLKDNEGNRILRIRSDYSNRVYYALDIGNKIYYLAYLDTDKNTVILSNLSTNIETVVYNLPLIIFTKAKIQSNVFNKIIETEEDKINFISQGYIKTKMNPIITQGIWFNVKREKENSE